MSRSFSQLPIALEFRKTSIYASSTRMRLSEDKLWEISARAVRDFSLYAAFPDLDSPHSKFT